MRESHVPCVQTESCVDMSKRNVQLHFRVSEKEADVIKKKMEESGIKSIGAYLRKMAVDGYCIRLDFEEVRELLKLLRINSNNINQYTKKANETGHIYEEDINHIKHSQEELWEIMKEILKRLSDIQ